MKQLVLVLMAMLAMVLSGCASTASGPSGQEPSFLAVANMTGAPLQIVTVSKPGDKLGEGRYGSISPVPAGAMQLIERPTNRKTLPSEIQVSWVTVYGRQQTRVVPLREAMRQATGAENEALIIELRSDGSAVAVVKLLR